MPAATEQRADHRTKDDRDGTGPSLTTDFRALTWLGIAAPILFLALVETFRFLVVESDPLHRAEHVAIAAVMAVGVVAFALGIFHLIRQAERRIVRQNRELGAINAVSTAIQGELGVEEILDAALRAVVERTGATEAAVVIFAHDGRPEAGLERRLVVAPHASVGAIGSDQPHLLDIPLSRGQSIVGRLRLHLPEGVDDLDLLTSATLQNIGHQLACSIEIGQLVSDLQRRKSEGHALYDVLLRISSQKPLRDVLGAVVHHARDLLQADEAAICLNPATSSLLRVGSSSGIAVLADGTVCVRADADRLDRTERGPLVGSVPDGPGGPARAWATLSSPEGSLGELWVGRDGERPFNGRERGYVQTLGELAGIAITSARMRENERQVAILAERDRIAREMHDNLAQVLGTMHLRLRVLGSKIATTGSPEAAGEVTELADIGEDAYRDVREAILGLRESSRRDRDLLESLRAYLDRYSHQSGVRTALETDLDDPPAILPGAELQVIRVIQEALTNVRKHARVRAAVVRVESDESSVSFSIEDAGRGFDVAATLLDGGARFGLQGMRERMGLAGGSLSIESSPGRGTRVIARVPRVLSPSAPLVEVANAG